jgi:hypothetical protein
MGKHTVTTYTCDLCDGAIPTIEDSPPRHRIPLAHSAICHLCGACSQTHAKLVVKLQDLVRAATPETPYSQYQQQGTQWGPHGT